MESGFKPERGDIWVRYWEGILGCEGGEAIEQVAQRSFASLEVLRARLDGALNNLVCWKVSLSTVGDWNEISFKVLPKAFYDFAKFCSYHAWTASACEPVADSCIVASKLQTVFCIQFKSSDYLHNQLDEPVLPKIQESFYLNPMISLIKSLH